MAFTYSNYNDIAAYPSITDRISRCQKFQTEVRDLISAEMSSQGNTYNPLPLERMLIQAREDEKALRLEGDQQNPLYPGQSNRSRAWFAAGGRAR